MKKLIWMAAAALLCWSLPTHAQDSGQQDVAVYGAPFEGHRVMSTGRLPVLMQDQKELKDIELGGYVTEVCQKEGCWLKLSMTNSEGPEVLVKMKDHAFLVPKDIAGQWVMVHGTVTKKAVSVEEQQHYLKDAGATQEEIDQITAPKDGYVMIADGVKIRKQ